MEDLKKIVVEALDKNGSLDIIRAQLRSSVFSAIQSEQKKTSAKTEANKAMETEQGQFAAELIRDLLEKSEAVHSLHVFSLESQVQPDTRNKLNRKLGLGNDPAPALFKFIKDFKSKHIPQDFVVKEEVKEVKEVKEVRKVEVRDERKEEDPIDDYSEDFEEIEEDIEAQSMETGKESQRYYESVGSSGGVDPSVDSLALDQCDYLENVKRPKN